MVDLPPRAIILLLPTVVLNCDTCSFLALLAVEMMIDDNEKICAYCSNEEHMTIVLKLLNVIASALMTTANVPLLANSLIDDYSYNSTFLDAIVSCAVLYAQYSTVVMTTKMVMIAEANVVVIL